MSAYHSAKKVHLAIIRAERFIIDHANAQWTREDGQQGQVKAELQYVTIKGNTATRHLESCTVRLNAGNPGGRPWAEFLDVDQAPMDWLNEPISHEEEKILRRYFRIMQRPEHEGPGIKPGNQQTTPTGGAQNGQGRL